MNENNLEESHLMYEQGGLGCLPSTYDVRDYTLSSSVDISELPEEFKYENLHIKNQGLFPTCTAYVASQLVEFHNFKDTSVYTPFSTEFIYGYRNIDCEDDYLEEGMSIRDALKVIQKYGDVTYRELPGNHTVDISMKNVRKNLDKLKESAYPNRISTYYKVKSVDEIKYALHCHGPVAAGMKWYDETKVDKDGYLLYDESKNYEGHAVMLVGYEKDSFIVQNSWGSFWGVHGTFKLKFEEVKTLIQTAYCVTDEIVNVHKPIENVSWLSTLINLVVNIFRSWFGGQ